MNEKTNTEEVFQCICGKQFKTKQSLASHKSHCKIYLETLRQEKESRRLPNGLFKCENPDCGKEHDGSYGSGRFSCRECSNHYIALTKINAKNPNVKAHLDKLRLEGKLQYHTAPYGTWKCIHCGEIFETRAKLKEHIKIVHYKIISTDLTCPFCGTILKNKYSKGGHIRNCKFNPNRETYKKIAKETGKKLSKMYEVGEIIPTFKGKHHTDETKRKMRESTCQYLKNNNPHPCRYNKKSIKFFDELSQRNGWNLKHAENGGEFYTGIGYWLDAYDIEKNIVVEYDESAHYVDVQNNILREKDLNRQQEIIEHLHCEYWRYNETTKVLWKVEKSSQ